MSSKGEVLENFVAADPYLAVDLLSSWEKFAQKYRCLLLQNTPKFLHCLRWLDQSLYFLHFFAHICTPFQLFFFHILYTIFLIHSFFVIVTVRPTLLTFQARGDKRVTYKKCTKIYQNVSRYSAQLYFLIRIRQNSFQVLLVSLLNSIHRLNFEFG